MKTTELQLPGPVVLEPTVFEDERGFFMESWNRRTFESAVGLDPAFVQDNHSRSARGVLRGIHYQLEPHAQATLIRVTHGAVWDVVVDLRRSSATFGQWAGLELSAENKLQLWIPTGFGHGFVALTEIADLAYKTTDYYNSDLDRSLRWNDPTIGIEWPIDDLPTLSGKDRQAPILSDADVFD